MVFGKVSRLIVSVSVAALLASCNSLGVGGESKSTEAAQTNGNAQIMPLAPANPSSSNTPIGTATNAQGAAQPVVQGTCPQIFMKDQDAIFRTYAKGKTGDNSQIVHQAAIGDYTRQCTLNEQNLSMTVVAQIRLIAGPAGGPGRVTLPLRITAYDGQDVVSSEVVPFTAEIPAGQTAAQVLFRKDGFKLPVGSGALVRINIGFDQGQAAKTKKGS
ncbi:hypothetical protein N2599_02820 [Rhizobium sullae]|uniref:Lipoprotein n=1 Tax=Rhizobium sullae TaxID=50338 RepID=A0ABY5XPH8_RHISU|nr:hypothetical protein [Rhizobium sullae]UWU16529.1 hypothetical protein N2599_02820 [Rhizobium sullae]